MKNFLLISNPSKDPEMFYTKKIRNHILRRGGTCQCVESREDAFAGPDGRLSNLDPVPDCVMSLGGDGTFVRAAGDLAAADLNLPMIGVNMGTLGYLCEVEDSYVIPAVDRIMEDNVIIEKRLKLYGEVMRGDEIVPIHTALNDIVIYRSGLAQIIKFNLYVNGRFLCSYSADGMVIATPTGSSAYNLSAGGPIVEPNARMILLTAVSPQGMTFKSIVIGSEDEIMVEVLKRNSRSTGEEVNVTFDGDHMTPMYAGDILNVRRSRDDTVIMKLNETSFIERLHKKLN